MAHVLERRSDMRRWRRIARARNRATARADATATLNAVKAWATVVGQWRLGERGGP
jgi:hypothetical protein